MTGAAVAEQANVGATPHSVYPVEEWGYVDVPAAEVLRGDRLDVYGSVIDRGYFTLRPRGGALRLQAGGFVGVIPLNERVTIEVTPRVPLGNLSRIIRIAEHVPKALEDSARWYEQEPDMYPSLVDLYALALAGYVDDIALRGLLREYVEHHETTSFPRGRILMNESVTSLRSKGVTHKLAASWYQRTVDNSCNRCIKYAVWFLARHRSHLVQRRATKQSRRVLSALNRAYRQFDGVQLDLSRGFLRDRIVLGQRPVPIMRSYYRPVLDLCLAIIRQQAISLDRASGDLGLPSLVVDMSKAFEAYLRNVLARAAEHEDWGLRVLDGNRRAPGGGEKRLFHTGIETKATPDVVVVREAETGRAYPLLIEVKYKPSDRALDRDDLNQAISYGVSFECHDVVLAYPRSASADAGAGLQRLGTIGDVVVHQYVCDLGVEDLSTEEHRLVRDMRSLLELTE